MVENTGKLHLRGVTKDKPYVMCRYGDNGPYSPNNVYCGTHSDNVTDQYRYSDKIGWKLSDEQRSIIGSKGGLASSSKTKERLSHSEKEIKERFEQITHIDLTNYGWVGKVAKVWNVSHTQVRRYIEKYYDGEVYKR